MRHTLHNRFLIDGFSSVDRDHGTLIGLIDILLDCVALERLHKRLQFRAVFIALADSEGTICRKFSCGMGRGRGKVRSSAAQNAFDMLRRRLLGLPL